MSGLDAEQRTAGAAANGHGYGSLASPDDPSGEATTQPVDSTRTALAQTKAANRPSRRALAPDLLRGTLMVLMALDHVPLALGTFRHGTGQTSEADGEVVHEWNRAIAYTTRTMTHLCGPGFTFLLGMGVVYLSESRSRLGWSSARLLRYFAVRTLVLTGITVLMGFLFTGGRIWFMNAVMFSLAIDLFLAGLLWIIMRKTEVALACFLAERIYSPTLPSSDQETEPLLHEEQIEAYTQARARKLSRCVHNVSLLVVGAVTIWWNIWLSPDGGRCRDSTSTSAKESSSNTIGNLLFRLWFWPVTDPESRIMSVFPPLAWLSFSILGLLYGRVLSAKRRSREVLAVGSAVAAAAFALLFVLTRVFRFGSLSEDCMQTPEHRAHPDANPYLVSPESFFYIIKYPPDIPFWAFTLAGNLILLAVFEAIPPSVARRLTLLLDLGSSALFFYVFHFIPVFSIGFFLVAHFGHETDAADPLRPEKKQMAIDSITVFLATWATVILLMWPLCRWYGRFKSSRPADSVWRFF